MSSSSTPSKSSEHPDGGEPSVLIKGHTTRGGRDVTFRHDEILDWYGNIRLSHGYALTFASAQGLTVDHAFLLADEKPARETIYPAATRHREGLDIYIDRRPLAFDIEAQRPEDQQASPFPTRTCSSFSPGAGQEPTPRSQQPITSIPPNNATTRCSTPPAPPDSSNPW